MPQTAGAPRVLPAPGPCAVAICPPPGRGDELSAGTGFTVVVDNLPPHVSATQLYVVFHRYGKVLRAWRTHHSQGMVTFSREEEAVEAVKGEDHRLIQSAALRVSAAFLVHQVLERGQWRCALCGSRNGVADADCQGYMCGIQRTEGSIAAFEALIQGHLGGGGSGDPGFPAEQQAPEQGYYQQPGGSSYAASGPPSSGYGLSFHKFQQPPSDLAPPPAAQTVPLYQREEPAKPLTPLQTVTVCRQQDGEYHVTKCEQHPPAWADTAEAAAAQGGRFAGKPSTPSQGAAVAVLPPAAAPAPVAAPPVTTAAEADPPQQQGELPRSVIVTNVPKNITQVTLSKVFTKYCGREEGAELTCFLRPAQQSTPRALAEAQVVFPSSAAAQAAISGESGRLVDNAPIICTPAAERFVIRVTPEHAPEWARAVGERGVDNAAAELVEVFAQYGACTCSLMDEAGAAIEYMSATSVADAFLGEDGGTCGTFGTAITLSLTPGSRWPCMACGRCCAGGTFSCSGCQQPRAPVDRAQLRSWWRRALVEPHTYHPIHGFSRPPEGSKRWEDYEDEDELEDEDNRHVAQKGNDSFREVDALPLPRLQRRSVPLGETHGAELDARADYAGMSGAPVASPMLLDAHRAHGGDPRRQQRPLRHGGGASPLVATQGCGWGGARSGGGGGGGGGAGGGAERRSRRRGGGRR